MNLLRERDKKMAIEKNKTVAEQNADMEGVASITAETELFLLSCLTEFEYVCLVWNVLPRSRPK